MTMTEDVSLPNAVTFPSSRATLRPGVTGTPVEIAGQTWLLADWPHFGGVWDDIYDRAVLRGECDSLSVAVAAEMLLISCHKLDLDDAVRLVRLADPEDLASAVRTALFGPEEARRTYSQWAISALLANGLNPDRVPAVCLRDVLDHLVATGRAVPADKWVSSAEAAAERAAILKLKA